MTASAIDPAPRRTARLAGLLYVLVIAGGAFALPVLNDTLVRGDPAATAANVLSREGLYRLAFAADLVGGLAYVGVVALLWGLLKPAGPALARMAGLFGLGGCVLGAVAGVFRLAPAVLLGERGDQVSLAYSALRLHAVAHNTAMVFFGVYCLLTGVLIWRSGFLPRLLGLLVMAAGIGWLTNSFTGFLAPAMSRVLFPAIIAPGFLGEVSLTLWLLFVGVNEPCWKEAAR